MTAQTKTKAIRQAFGETLVEIGKENPSLVVLDADVCTSTMTSLFRAAFPERFYQVGIAEQNMIGIAAGMATVGGIIPVVSTFAVFAAKRVCDQVSISVAYPRLNVKINGSYGGVPTGMAGATHQAFEDIAIMRATPNMAVVVPADAVECVHLTRAAILDYEGPVYIRTARCESPVLFDERSYKFEWGKAVKLRDGNDVTIIATGIRVPTALDAATTLAQDGIQARVLNIHTIKPIDEEAIIDAATQTAGIVTVENHSIIGGLGGAVCEIVAKYAPTRVIRVGVPDRFGESGDDEKIFTKYNMDCKATVCAAKQIVLGKETPLNEKEAVGRARSVRAVRG